MTTTITGLTAAEVAERVADGRVNNVPDAPVRSLGQIIRANVLTPVNGIISTLFVLILIAGYPADALFAAHLGRAGPAGCDLVELGLPAHEAPSSRDMKRYRRGWPSSPVWIRVNRTRSLPRTRLRSA